MQYKWITRRMMDRILAVRHRQEWMTELEESTKLLMWQRLYDDGHMLCNVFTSNHFYWYALYKLYKLSFKDAMICSYGSFLSLLSILVYGCQ